MNLIYVWNEDYLNKEKYRQTGFCLSTKYDVKYDIENKKVTVIQNPSYISGFWGENIFDVMAIVGDNGSGKTMLLNYLIEVIKSIDRGNAYDMEFFAIFENTNKLMVLATSKYMDIEVYGDMETDRYLINSMSCDRLASYKFGYFTNALSLNDYMAAHSGYIYDASVGGLIKNITKDDLEMHYIKAGEDNIPNYFTNQFCRVVDFLYNGNPKDIDIGFNWPKRLDIYLNRSSACEDNIVTSLEKMKADNSEINEILTIRNFRFNFYLQPLTDRYSYTWTTNLVISLIKNLFKDLCVPQTTVDQKDKAKDAVIFIRLLEDLKKRRNREKTIYKEMLYFLDRINEKINCEPHYKRYKNYILWIEENEKYISEGCQYNPNCCSIPLDDEHRNFIMELLVHYKNTKFAFPYFIFRLGLSTGELNFLNLYANMYNMLGTNREGKITVVKSMFTGTIDCTNILLAFDEADLSLHPKWQQKYLYWLLEFIKSVFPMCQVHVIIATHSPIMLSDFPNENILYLDDKCEDTKRNVKTFGSNIHDLFLDSFFLSSTGTIGEFAEQKIKEIVNQLNNKELSDVEKENILNVIQSVGDDVVRNKLLQLYSQKANKYIAQEKKVEDSDTIDMTINLLKMQKEQIERMIMELEQKKK